MTEIVKVQIAAFPKGAPALIYPKSKAQERTTQQKLDADAMRKINGAHKAYFTASFLDGKWKLGRKLPDQGW